VLLHLKLGGPVSFVENTVGYLTIRIDENNLVTRDIWGINDAKVKSKK